MRPNTTLTAADFPFHAFTNPNDNGSAMTRDRREVVGSAGIARRTFVDVSDDGAIDVGADTGSPGAFSARRPGAGSIGSTARDLWALVPAIGQRGHAVPLQTFAELLSGVGRDGSRAHTLQQPCVP